MTNTGEEGISSEGRKEFQARGGRNFKRGEEGISSKRRKEFQARGGRNFKRGKEGISSEGRKEFQVRGGRNFKCEVNSKLSEHFYRMSKRNDVMLLESCVQDARPYGVGSSILWPFL